MVEMLAFAPVIIILSLGIVAVSKRKRSQLQELHQDSADNTVPPARQWGWGSQGQHVTRHEDARSETVTPSTQVVSAMRWRLAICCVWSSCILIVYAAFAICNLVLAGTGIVILSLIVAGAYTLWTYRIDWSVIAPLAAAAIIAEFVVGAYLWFGVFSIPYQVYVLIGTAWLIGCMIYTTIKPARFGVYRFLSEIVDPNGPTPPRKAVTRWTTIFPDTPEPVNVDEDFVNAIIDRLERIEQRQTAPAHIIAPTPGNWGNSNNSFDAQKATKFLEGAIGNKDVVAKPVGEPVVTALTSGNHISVSTLVTFARKSAEVGTSAAYWKKVPGWTEQTWNDVVEIWAMFDGIFVKGRPGKSAEFLVDTDKALAALLGYVERYTERGKTS